MRPQAVMAHGEWDDELPIGIGIDGEQRRSGSRGWEAGSVVPPADGVAVTGAGQQPFVERDRPRDARQRIGHGVLPAGVSA
jgi:hypothetical protein